jgi:hypothetical protein
LKNGNPISLVDFEDTGCLYDWRLLLAVGKALRAIAIDVNAGELLTIVVIDGDLPMAVLAAPIPVESASLLFLGFFHYGLSPQRGDYGKFGGPAQVAS